MKPRSENQVSVLTASLGYGRFIRDALASVPSKRENITCEHIVQDGGSTDETLDILESFDLPHPLRWTSEPDRGQSDALNKALAVSDSRWVAWLNADEFYLPDALKKLVACGEATGTDVVFGDAVFTDAAGRLVRLLPQHRFDQRVLRWYGTFIPSCAALFRRSALGDAPWDVDLKLLMDWDLYLKLLANGARFLHVPQPIGAFRVHEERVSAMPRSEHAHEYRVIRERHGIPSGLTTVGRVLHTSYKIADGSYRRQLAARKYRGTDLRWFRPETGVEGWNTLLKSAYPAPASRR